MRKLNLHINISVTKNNQKLYASEIECINVFLNNITRALLNNVLYVKNTTDETFCTINRYCTTKCKPGQ